jgi:hypothetical protein
MAGRGPNPCLMHLQQSRRNGSEEMGASRMEVRRSTCVASFGARLTHTTALYLPLIEAPPGGRRIAGYRYQGLSALGQSGIPPDSSENADGFRDVTIPRVV